MRYLEVGDKLIKGFEDCRLEAYLCPAGIWTIGWGHTDGVKPGMTCTQEQADQWFEEDRNRFCDRVRAVVSPDLNDYQFTAAVCFAFNVKRWDTRPLFAFLSRGDVERAEAHWLLYCKANGSELAGLKRRREAELQLFKTPIA